MAVRVSAVLRSLAQHLDDLGLGAYRPTGPFPTDLTVPAIILGDFPQAPILAVAINAYGRRHDVDTDEVDKHNPLIRVQLAWRTDSENSLDAEDLADNAYDLLHTNTPGPWPGGVRPLWVYRTITAPSDRDDNDRWIKADSYEIRLNPGE